MITSEITTEITTTPGAAITTVITTLAEITTIVKTATNEKIIILGTTMSIGTSKNLDTDSDTFKVKKCLQNPVQHYTFTKTVKFSKKSSTKIQLSSCLFFIRFRFSGTP